MRQVRENQPSFPLHQSEHRHGQELEQISRILDENPTLAEVVVQQRWLCNIWRAIRAGERRG